MGAVEVEKPVWFEDARSSASMLRRTASSCSSSASSSVERKGRSKVEGAGVSSKEKGEGARVEGGWGKVEGGRGEGRGSRGSVWEGDVAEAEGRRGLG